MYARYCDGGSFTGNNETVTNFNGTSLYFRGHRILNAIIEDLLKNRGAVRNCIDSCMHLFMIHVVLALRRPCVCHRRSCQRRQRRCGRVVHCSRCARRNASAGGLATFLHIDQWAASMPSTVNKIVAMPDSGFFLDYQVCVVVCVCMCMCACACVFVCECVV